MPDNGLNKIRGFVVSELNGEPLKGIAVSLVARYSSSGSGPIDKPIDKIFPGAKFEESASSDQSKTVNKEKTQRVTLGVLYSDNVGYFSFDNPMSSALHQSLVILELFCPYDPDLKAKGPITIGQGKDFLEALHSLNPLVFEIRVNPKIPTACHKKVLSIQKPDYMDWEISPKSFVDVTAPVIGEDDCQKFLNSTNALQEYFFHELTNLQELPQSGNKVKLGDGALMIGEVKEYRQTWTPVGHALGDIVYSLALSPCESVNLAVIDWSREDSASRVEGVEYGEALYHAQRHDRSIDEIVGATLTEIQSGESTVWGVGAASGVEVPIDGLEAGSSVTAGVGGGSTSSQGKRTLSGNSVQNIADTVSQISNLQRSLRSTVIVQATQKEKDVIQTRTVFNHNHGHALTVQYYEVLRHMSVRTEYLGISRVVLVPFEPMAFTDDTIVKYKGILQRSLLDPSLSKCFDSLLALKYGIGAPAPAVPIPPVEIPWEGDDTVKRIKVTITINNNHPSLNLQDIWFYIGATNDGKQVGFGGAQPTGMGESVKLNLTIDDFNPLRKDLVQFGVRNKTVRLDWKLTSFRVEWNGNSSSGVLYDSGAIEYNFKENTYESEYPGDVAPLAPKPLPDPEAERKKAEYAQKQSDYAKSQEQMKGERQMLIDHLNTNKVYYNKVVRFFQDPDERFLDLRELDFSYNGRPLIMQIENTPLAAKGNCIAFPLIGAGSRIQQDGDPEPVGKIISLPTRGVFAETMLSSCNAIEKRDVTRYWNWMETLSKGAPEIQGIQPGSRNVTADLQPSAMPSPVVQITNAPAVPDPAGLNAALNLLGQPEIFRDMSGQKAVSDLLDNLVKGAVSLNQARQQAQAIKDNQQSRQQKGTSGSSANSRRSDPSETNPPKQYDLLNNIKYARDEELTTDEGAKGAATRLLGGELLASADDSFVPTTDENDKILKAAEEEIKWAKDNPEGYVDLWRYFDGQGKPQPNPDIVVLWNFDVGKAVINKFEPKLQSYIAGRFSDWKKRGDSVAVAGFASATGNDDSNKAISIERAGEVVKLLIDKAGISADRIWSDGYGASSSGDAQHPYVPWEPESYAFNRRVEIHRVKRQWTDGEEENYDRLLEITNTIAENNVRTRLAGVLSLLKEKNEDGEYVNDDRYVSGTGFTRACQYARESGFEWLLSKSEWENPNNVPQFIMHLRKMINAWHPAEEDAVLKRCLININNEIYLTIENVNSQATVGGAAFLDFALLVRDWIFSNQSDEKSIYYYYGAGQ